MKSFFNTFLKAGLPFGIIMGISFSLSYNWQHGLTAGFGAGSFFGLLIAGFVAYQTSKFTKDRPLSPDEKLVKESAANHFLNGEGVGGWIYLTDKRLFYKSHNTNIQNHELIIPLQEIADAEKTNTFGLIPNQLRLTLQNGNTEKFVVNGAKEWVNTLKTII